MVWVATGFGGVAAAILLADAATRIGTAPSEAEVPPVAAGRPMAGSLDAGSTVASDAAFQ
ncbi:MAG TPA: hypothetical protein VNY29_10425 [Terriglobales bacterium]|nr:hypothetical protein [Terriglobales bacterium]